MWFCEYNHFDVVRNTACISTSTVVTLLSLSPQSGNESDTRREVAAGPSAEVTNIAAGAKTEAAAAGRSGAAAGTARAGTVAAPRGTTRSTGQWVTPADTRTSGCVLVSSA